MSNVPGSTARATVRVEIRVQVGAEIVEVWPAGDRYAWAVWPRGLSGPVVRGGSDTFSQAKRAAAKALAYAQGGS